MRPDMNYSPGTSMEGDGELMGSTSSLSVAKFWTDFSLESSEYKERVDSGLFFFLI